MFYTHTHTNTHTSCMQHPTQEEMERDYEEQAAKIRGSAVVYIGHIPAGFYEEAQFQFFSQYGKVKSFIGMRPLIFSHECAYFGSCVSMWVVLEQWADAFLLHSTHCFGSCARTNKNTGYAAAAFSGQDDGTIPGLRLDRIRRRGRGAPGSFVCSSSAAFILVLFTLVLRLCCAGFPCLLSRSLARSLVDNHSLSFWM